MGSSTHSTSTLDNPTRKWRAFYITHAASARNPNANKAAIESRYKITTIAAMSLSQQELARIIALAALMQASKLVDDIARQGQCDSHDFQTMIHSMFAAPTLSPEEQFSGRDKLTTGLHITQQLLSGAHVQQAKTSMNYTAGMIAVEKRLKKQHDMLHHITEGMQRIQHQADYFSSFHHPTIIAAIADLYGETISTLKPRIIIHGKPDILRQNQNTQKIRALLFSGIHAAHLWQQYKGGHFRLLFGRKKLLQGIEHLLSTTTT